MLIPSVAAKGSTSAAGCEGYSAYAGAGCPIPKPKADMVYVAAGGGLAGYSASGLVYPPGAAAGFYGFGDDMP